MIKCYGVIPFDSLKQKVLLIHHQKGHWGFPKGKPEEGETAKETARRELKEESGLEVVHFLNRAPITETYLVNQEDKTVTYFPAVVSGEIELQEDEIQGFCWCDQSQAMALATFDEMKSVIQSCFEKE